MEVSSGRRRVGGEIGSERGDGGGGEGSEVEMGDGGDEGEHVRVPMATGFSGRIAEVCFKMRTRA